MYSIYVDGVCVHNDIDSSIDRKFISPKLSLADNSAGSLEAIIPPNNICYSTLKRMKSTVSVYREGVEIWRGRVLKDDEDFYKCKKIFCEGALSFLNDSIQLEKEFDGTFGDFVNFILTEHNSKVCEERRIFAGDIMLGMNHIYTNIHLKKTYQVINDNLIDGLNCHLQIRYLDGKAYLDCLTTYRDNYSQTIEFGKNLLDFTKSFDMSDIATVIIPFGAKFEDSENRLTVEGVNNGSIYVEDTEAIENYGRIEKVIIWDDILESDDLLYRAKKYLSDFQFDNVVIKVSALDLHYMDRDISFFNLLDNIKCISMPHGLNRFFPLTKMEIPIDDPSGVTITLNSEKKESLSSEFDNYTTKGEVGTVVSDTVKKEAPSMVKNEVNNQITSISTTIVNTSVIKSETMQATWCFSKYMLVQFLETNFDALDVNKPYSRLRKYIKIYDDNIQVIEAEISDTETECYKDPNGQKLYWTAIEGSDARKFFTYTSPLAIAKEKRPEGVTDVEFEDMYSVKVRKTVSEYIKGSLGFPLNLFGTGEPELVLGAGDTAGNGKYCIGKNDDGGSNIYTSRTSGGEYGFESKDDGNYLITNSTRTTIYPIAVRADISDVSDLPVGTIIFQGAVTNGN